MIQPLAQGHAAVLAQLHIPEDFNILVELWQKGFLRGCEDILEDGIARGTAWRKATA